ncbi:hypothetical protein POI8812_00912 [Pontivivens insulae]|uniref:TadE-like domain-containing protein n=2 Tax=Pontivivens insulae TaxID=1639689 RepID=A0A2R8A985_9RHOB|nr:TadE-like protein [Pontivivens insulae]SPF28610.1 hypothetical protein POI8812_00912 [Pontivivens insulae]
MTGSVFHKFRRDENGAAAMEFVIVFLPLMFLIFLIVQVAVAYHWSLSAQKGLEVASRTAAVNVPVASELVSITAQGISGITRSTVAGASVGDDCFDGACEAIPTYSCSGASFPPHNTSGVPTTCDFDRFMEIYDALDGFAYQLDSTDLTVTYEDVGLGRAGRAYVPLITLSISEQSLPTIMRLWSFNVTDDGNSETLEIGELTIDQTDDGRVEFVVPAMTSVIVAEDLGG